MWDIAAERDAVELRQSWYKEPDEMPVYPSSYTFECDICGEEEDEEYFVGIDYPVGNKSNIIICAECEWEYMPYGYEAVVPKLVQYLALEINRNAELPTFDGISDTLSEQMGLPVPVLSYVINKMIDDGLINLSYSGRLSWYEAGIIPKDDTFWNMVYKQHG